VIYKPQELGGHGPRWAAAPQEKKVRFKYLETEMLVTEPHKQKPATYKMVNIISGCRIAYGFIKKELKQSVALEQKKGWLHLR